MIPHKYLHKSAEVWSLVTQRWLYGIFPQTEAWAAPAIIAGIAAVVLLLVVLQ